MRLGILGMGTALPPNSLEEEEAVSYAYAYNGEGEDDRRKLKALYRMVGIKKRQLVVLDESRDPGEFPAFYPSPNGENKKGPSIAARMEKYEEEALPLAFRSARQALAHADVAPASITHLVTVSCSGFSAPGVDIDLIDQLGLPPTTERTHVGFMGCHGALNGLRVARGFVESDANARVLICAVELCSLHFQYGWHPEQVVANALFADGAAAVVAGGVEDGVDIPWQIAATGSCLIPDSKDAMSWKVRNNGFEMSLSPRVPNLIQQHLEPWVSRWLNEQGLTVDGIGSWAIHPGGPRILKSVCGALALEREAATVSLDILANHGNMSSPTLLFILDELRESQAPRPCVALGFGPGLVAEAVLFV